MTAVGLFTDVAREVHDIWSNPTHTVLMEEIIQVFDC